MKERFLHFVWNYQLINSRNLFSVEGNSIEILHKGTWNSNDSGPDFFNAKIKIDQTIWVGNIEIHPKSSDWDLHKHSQDRAYSNTILHVVFQHDKNVDFLKSRFIPTLELQNFISEEIIFSYKELIHRKESFIACENQIQNIPDEIFRVWLERLLIQRLERKVEEIEKLYLVNQKSWEKLLFKQLASVFGLKINSESFEIWVNSFDFKVLQKVQNNPNYVRALFYGQAGFLDFASEDEFILKLQSDYNFLRNKFQLEPISSSIFKFFRLRPPNFPTIRLAQLAEIYVNYSNLFGLLMGSKSLRKLETIFDEIQLPSFWDNHFTFQKQSDKIHPKKISKELIERILINVLVPIKFAYARSIGADLQDELFDLLMGLPPENNVTIEKFSELNIHAKNAFETQALLELKKHYCESKNCLNCAIGLQILKNV